MTMTASSPALAPSAPGSLGTPVDARAFAVYLDALGGWRTARREELDELDRAALASSTGPAATSDIVLSLALWKAVSDRWELLTATWDSGRVGQTERLQLASLVWGRLDAATASGLSVSLPEACRLSDALVAQLRVRLGLDPTGAETTERIRDLRAQMERIRDQVGLEPAGTAQTDAAGRQSQLARRLGDIAARAARGGDVGGLLGPLEIESATFERDLIVAGARRRDAAALLSRARAERAELEAREAALRLIADDCVATVDPAPRYAVPDVDALGPVPNTPDRLTAYLTRLGQVSRAMTLAQGAYTAAHREYDELTGRLTALQAKAAATGLADRPDVTQAYALARSALAERPCRMAIARQLVTLYQTYLSSAPPRPTPTRSDRG